MLPFVLRTTRSGDAAVPGVEQKSQVSRRQVRRCAVVTRAAYEGVSRSSRELKDGIGANLPGKQAGHLLAM